MIALPRLMDLMHGGEEEFCLLLIRLGLIVGLGIH